MRVHCNVIQSDYDQLNLFIICVISIFSQIDYFPSTVVHICIPVPFNPFIHVLVIIWYKLERAQYPLIFQLLYIL